MDIEFSVEFLELLSLHDLQELKRFYEGFSVGVYNPHAPKVDYGVSEKRLKFIEAAIKQRICSYDEKLFGSSLIRPEDKQSYYDDGYYEDGPISIF
jgi:hypothetical protein